MRGLAGLGFVFALIASPAIAADLAPRPVVKASAVAPLPQWSGLYVGAHAGWSAMKQDWFFPTNEESAIYSVDGFAGGVQIGVNWQNGNWLLGLEADGSWTDIGATTVCPQATFACRINVDWLAFATARIGYIAGPSLYFLKGGAVWAGNTFENIPLVAGNGTTQHKTLQGWTIGGGFEQAVGNGWSWKIEYNYLDFGRKVVNIVNDADSIDQFGHRVIFGINRRFGAAQ